MPAIIIDASVALKWYLEEEYSVYADSLSCAYKNNQIKIVAPQILKWEILNGLLAAVYSKRITFELAEKYILNFLKLGIEEINLKGNDLNIRILNIAYKNGLSVYDGYYIALAEKLHCSFYTADKKLYNKLHKDSKSYFVKWIEEFK